MIDMKEGHDRMARWPECLWQPKFGAQHVTGIARHRHLAETPDTGKATEMNLFGADQAFPGALRRQLHCVFDLIRRTADDGARGDRPLEELAVRVAARQVRPVTRRTQQ